MSGVDTAYAKQRLSMTVRAVQAAAKKNNLRIGTRLAPEPSSYHRLAPMAGLILVGGKGVGIDQETDPGEP
jgi:hypothetical protein